MTEQQGRIRATYGENEWHFGDLRMPEGDGPFPVVLVVHGGFWYAKYGLDLMDAMADDFTARGYATWNIEYRRVGHEGGGYSGTLVDVAAAADHLRELAKEYPLDLARVVAIGHSAGGHLALWLGGRRNLLGASALSGENPLPLKGIVSLAGCADLRVTYAYRPQPCIDFLGGSPEEVPERYDLASPAELLPLGVPTVLVHGTGDASVSVEISRAYLETAKQAGDLVELVELSGMDHFCVIDPQSEAWPPIVRAVEKLID